MNRILTLVIVLLVPFFLAAQSGSVEILSLNDCVKIALENNIDINTSRNLAEIARLTAKGSYSNILPRLDANFSGGQLQFGESTYLGDNPIGVDPDDPTKVIYEQGLITQAGRRRDSYSAGLTLNQNVFDGGFWWNNIKQKKVLKEASKYDLILSENQVMKLVSQYYYELLKNMKLLNVYDLAVQRSQDQVNRTQSMFEIGSVAQVDVYRARVNLGQDQIRYINQKNTERQSRQLLNLALGRDPLIVFEIDTSVVFEPREVTLQQLLDLAVENQPALKSWELNVRSRELNAAMAKSPFWPTLGLRMTYSRDNEDLSKVYGDFDKNWSTSIGAGISWNLFNGFSDQVNYQTSKIEYKNAQLSLADYKRNLRSDVKNLFDSYNAIIEIVEINESNLEAASEEYRLANERYRLGSGTSLELREAQVNLTEAEQILVAAEYTAINTYIELSEAVGKVKEALNL
jgi:outer membrane protein TolC